VQDLLDPGFEIVAIDVSTRTAAVFRLSADDDLARLTGRRFGDLAKR
jgi:hypothetical protein